MVSGKPPLVREAAYDDCIGERIVPTKRSTAIIDPNVVTIPIDRSV